jgi:endonuclease/exonuclease/phosphatase family metal-dependent hydrolase
MFSDIDVKMISDHCPVLVTIDFSTGTE